MYVYKYMYVCIYIYTYICIHMQIHMYTETSDHKKCCRGRKRRAEILKMYFEFLCQLISPTQNIFCESQFHLLDVSPNLCK